MSVRGINYHRLGRCCTKTIQNYHGPEIPGVTRLKCGEYQSFDEHTHTEHILLDEDGKWRFDGDYEEDGK